MHYPALITSFGLFHLFCSNAVAVSAVLGLDLGTEYIKTTIVKPGIPLDIVLTKDSRRKEISAVAFKPAKDVKNGDFPERSYGSDAIALAPRFPTDVFPNLKALVGLAADDPIVKEYAHRHPSLKVVADKIRGTASFQSGAFVAEEHPWTVEEILAMQLQAIKKNSLALAGKGDTIKDVVITIPPFFTVEDKRSISLAADLAGLHILELITDGMAVGLNYATKRTFPTINDGGKSEINLVFDMGAGSTKATVLKFQGRIVNDVGKSNKTVQEIRALGSGWDRSLGGDAFNAIIVDDIIAKFIASPAAKKKGLTAEAVKGQGRVAAKLWSDAEKMRQVLSANANTQTFFEDIYQDLDFTYKITRAEFEQLIESHATRIIDVVQRSLNSARIKIDDIDSVILHGGASRTPLVHKELEKLVRDASKIKTNVNSDESAVFGAGFRGAALSPGYRVKEIRTFDIASYSIGIKWIDTDGILRRENLWQSSTILGPHKHYTFKNEKDPFTLTFYEQIPSSEILEKDILAVTTQNLTDSVAHLKEKNNCDTESIKLQLSTKINPESGEVDIVRLNIECELKQTEDDKESMVDSVKGLFGFGKKEQAPLSENDASSSVLGASTSSEPTIVSTTISSTVSPASAPSAHVNKKFRKAKVHKHSHIHVSYKTEIKGYPKLPEMEISRMRERLSAFAGSDKRRSLRDEALNQLESFAYKTRDLVQDAGFIEASTEKERADLEAKAEETSGWIYSGGAGAEREELRQRLKQLEEITKAVEARRTETTTRPEKITALQRALDDNKQLIISITNRVANDTKKHEEFSSKLSATGSATPSPSSIASDPTSAEENSSKETTSAATPDPETLDAPVYTNADIEKLQMLNDESSAWLADKVAQQEKLSLRDNPVLLSKDIDGKIKSLQELRTEIILKGIKKSVRSQRSRQKPKAEQTPISKVKGGQDSEEATSSTTKNPQATFTVGAGGQMPSEEEILELLQKQNTVEAEKESAGTDNTGGAGGEGKHDEL